MARKGKSGVNKSKAIREILTTNPDAKPKEILAALEAQGIKNITPTFISTIKTKFTKTGGKEPGRRGRPPGKANAAKKYSGKSSGGLSVENLIKARDLVRELGGLENAKSALEALAAILD